jgi:tetratricopeptide (TPR) repeat protein
LNKAAGLGWPRAQVERQRWITISNRDFAKAEPYLIELLDKSANDREVTLALAVGYNRKKLPHRATVLLDRLLQTDPNDGAALTARGTAMMQMLQADRALPDLEKADSVSGDHYYHYRAQFLLAECLRTLGQIEKAIEVYGKCSQEIPTDMAAIYNAGVCAHYLGRPDEAMADFQEVLRLRPDDVETLLQVAYLHDERRDLDEALAVLRKIEAAYPDEPQMLVQMAKTYQAKGNLEEAAKYRRRFEDLKRQWEERTAKEREKRRAS